MAQRCQAVQAGGLTDCAGSNFCRLHPGTNRCLGFFLHFVRMTLTALRPSFGYFGQILYLFILFIYFYKIVGQASRLSMMREIFSSRHLLK
jgi:hypothetical protein